MWKLVIQSCPTVCKPMDCSPPGSSVHEILQARIPEWIAISFSKGSSRLRDWTWVSCIPGRCFNLWVTREALFNITYTYKTLIGRESVIFKTTDDKEPACNAGDPGSIPESGRSPGEGNGYPLQYSCLRNPMDRGAWWAVVHGITESQTWLSN